MGKYLTRELLLPFSSHKHMSVLYRILKIISISPIYIKPNAHVNSHMVRPSSTYMQNNIHLVLSLSLCESKITPNRLCGNYELSKTRVSASLRGHPGDRQSFPSCAPDPPHLSNHCLGPWLIFIVNPIQTSNTNFCLN